MSNLETIYDILTVWATKFDFIETCTVGFSVESGTMLIVFYCSNGIRLEHTLYKYEMETMTQDVLDALEHYLFEKPERAYKLAEVGEE